MTEIVRMLNDEGIALFQQYIEQLRSSPTENPPLNLLKDPTKSLATPVAASIALKPHGRPFQSAYELGEYLFKDVLKGINKPIISREYRLWNWLELFLFDELCPLVNGQRAPLETAAYVFEKDFNYSLAEFAFCFLQWPGQHRVLPSAQTNRIINRWPLDARSTVYLEFANDYGVKPNQDGRKQLLI